MGIWAKKKENLTTLNWGLPVKFNFRVQEFPSFTNCKTLVTLIIYEIVLGSWDGNVSVFELETGKNLLEIKPQSWRINGKKTESQLYFSERTGESCRSRNIDYFLP